MEKLYFMLHVLVLKFTYWFSFIIISQVTTSNMSCNKNITVSHFDESPSFCRSKIVEYVCELIHQNRLKRDPNKQKTNNQKFIFIQQKMSKIKQ